MDSNNLENHIFKQYNQELEDIRCQLLSMGSLVEGQLQEAIEAFIGCDVELAKQVIKHDSRIDALEMALDKECTRILALRQPTAFDLRYLMAVLKITYELERMGDLAAVIAKMAISRSSIVGNKNTTRDGIQAMTTMIKTMLSDVLSSFAKMTIDRIPAITAQNESLDQEFGKIIKQQIVSMMEDPRNITATLNVLWAMRSLEQVADHVCEIYEHLRFMMEGK